MRLANIEKEFMSCLRRADKDTSTFLSELLPLKFINTEQQLFIYRSNVNGAHQKVLGQIYPACFNILGEDYFNQLCRLYRAEHPSVDADLNFYGKHFPVFIKNQIDEKVELKDFEYLGGLAKLEWSWHSCYFAKNNEEFSFEQLELVNESDQGDLIFELSESLSLHSTLYPLLEIWRANKDHLEKEQEFALSDSKSYFCVLQLELVPKLIELNKKQFELLSYVAKGLSLNEISNYMQDDFQQELMFIIQNKLIVGFSLKQGKQNQG